MIRELFSPLNRFINGSSNKVATIEAAANSNMELVPPWEDKERRLPRHYIPVGSEGTNIVAGQYEDEYVSELKGPNWYVVADQMFRSDGCVRKNIKMICDPILAANYFIKAGGNDPTSVKIKDFAHFLVFEDMGPVDMPGSRTLSSFLKFAVNGILKDGNAPFEALFKKVESHPIWGDYKGIKQIAYRNPRTFEKYVLNKDGSIKYVEQTDPSDTSPTKKMVRIPGKYLMIFVEGRQGEADWRGIAPLRSAYGAWLSKKKNLNYMLTATMRSMGFPVFTMPNDEENYEENVKYMREMLQKVTEGKVNGIILENGFDFKQMEIPFTTAEYEGAIRIYNVEIDMAFNAGFSSKDSDAGTGSYGARVDGSNAFYRSIQLMPKEILHDFNARILKPLIIEKFGIQQKYPEVDFNGIVGRDDKYEAETLGILVDKQLVVNDDRLKTQVAERYGLPEHKEAEKVDQKPAASQAHEHGENCGCGMQLTASQMHEAAQLTNAYNQIKEDAYDLSRWMYIIQFARSQALIEKMRGYLDEMGTEDGGREIIKDYRAGKLYLPYYNQYVNIVSIFLSDVALNAQDDVLKELGEPGVKASAWTAAKKKKKKSKKVEDLENLILDTAEVTEKKRLKQEEKERKEYERWKKTIEKVMKKEDIQRTAEVFDVLPKRIRTKLYNEVDLFLADQDAKIMNTMLFSINGRMDTTDSVNQLISDIQALRNDYLNGGNLFTTASNVVGDVVNSTRSATFYDPDINSQIEMFRFYNPNPKTAICQSLAGRIFTKEEYDKSPYLPPLHHNCNSTILPITFKDNAGGKIKPDPRGLTPEAVPGFSLEDVKKSAKFSS